MSYLSDLYDSTIGFIFPEFCCCCKRRGTLLCDDCYEQLNFMTLPASLNLENCYLDSVVTTLQYDDRSKKLIAELKYKSVIEVGRVLGELLYYATNIPSVDIITAVPLHPKKERLRGFNQAEIIAQTVAKNLSVPYEPLLERTTNTPSQAKTQSRSKRLSALADAFSLAVPTTHVSGKSILIVDDVVTTGTTLNECAKIIQKTDSKAIYGLGVASRQR